LVFLPSLDESISPQSGPVAIDEDEGSIYFNYEEDPRKRNRDDHFRRIKFKKLEEEKRLFYVAVTRARDYLCMLGSIKNDKYTGRLGYLADAFGALEGDLPFSIKREEGLLTRWKGASLKLEPVERFIDEPSYTDPLVYTPERIWKDVTEDTNIGIWHGKEGAAVGRVMHTLLEELSTGVLHVGETEERAKTLLRAEALIGSTVLDTIIKDFEKLRQSGLLEDIVLPRENSYAELPFVLEKGRYIYKGRIDRLVISDGTARVYDYKTFPIKDTEIPELKKQYGHQMEIYREAAEKLFSARAEAYLLFTHKPLIVPV
jgi:ATP-dependent exoDNAse (exonuclease V) beta subunit